MGATMDDWEMQAMRRRPHSFICLAPHACGVRCMLHALPLRNYPLHVQAETSPLRGGAGQEAAPPPFPSYAYWHGAEAKPPGTLSSPAKGGQSAASAARAVWAAHQQQVREALLLAGEVSTAHLLQQGAMAPSHCVRRGLICCHCRPSLPVGPRWHQ